MKTPEELAEYWERQAEPCCGECYKDAFLAGYHSRDEEMEKLKKEIAMLKAELKEVGNG